MVAPLVSGAVALAPKLFDLVDALFTSDDEKLEAKRKLIEMEQAGRLEELKVGLSAILAEANSADPWTSRARPTFLYVMYGAIGLCFIGAIMGIFWPVAVTTAAANLGALLGAIPESLWWLFGAGYLGYSGSRSFDKWKGSNN